MRRLSVLCVALLLFLAGCSGEEPVRRELTAMDTFMTLTVYGQSHAAGEALLEEAAGEIRSLEGLLSVTDPGSEIYRANHSGGEAVFLSDPVRELLEDSLARWMSPSTRRSGPGDSPPGTTGCRRRGSCPP